MNNIIAFNVSSPSDIALQIAARVKVRRLELDLTQEGLAARAGVKFATYRRFEQTGEISLRGLLQVGFALCYSFFFPLLRITLCSFNTSSND